MDTFWGLSSTAWTAVYTIITVGLLIVAVVAALYAKAQWEASKQQIKDARQTEVEASRPYVIATAEPSVVSNHLFDLVVRNIGRRPAMDVTVRLDPPPKRASETVGLEIAKIKMLTEPVAMIAPDQEMRVFYDSHIDRKGTEGLPSSHTVSLTYRDTSGHTYNEHSVMDLEALRGAMWTDAKTVHTIGKTLEEIKKVLGNASLLKRHGSLEVEAVTETRGEHEIRSDRQRYEASVRDLSVIRRLTPKDPSVAAMEAEIAGRESKHPDATPSISKERHAAADDQEGPAGRSVAALGRWRRSLTSR